MARFQLRRLTWHCTHLGYSRNDRGGIQGTPIFQYRGLNKMVILIIHDHIIDGVQGEGGGRVSERGSLIPYVFIDWLA